MDPDFLSIDSNELQLAWESGATAMAVGWSSRAAALLDTEGDSARVAANTATAPAPTVGKGTAPAVSLWWNGFAIVRNVSEADAETSFRIMLDAISPALLAEHANASIWLVDGYAPTKASAAAIATIAAGAEPYPVLAPMSLLHAAIGNNLSEFMQGRETAERALADAAAYRVTARERGFLE